MATIKGRRLVPLAFAGGVLGILVMASIAGATHPRPQGATPVRFSLVPAYEPCTTPNHRHGPPLAFPSCHPPAPASSFITVGTPDANGAPAKFEGFFKFAVHTVAGPPPQSQLRITTQVDDVRCRAGTSACGNANATGGPDYTGELQTNATIRTTDHYNAVSAGGGTDPATVIDIPFPVQLSCTNTSDTSIGASCTANTSATALGIPNDTWFNGKRVVVEMTQLQVFDGGADGIVGTTPNTLFAVEGLFVP